MKKDPLINSQFFCKNKNQYQHQEKYYDNEPAQINWPKCIDQKQIYSACFNQSCQINKPLFCDNTKCECRLNHKDCLKVQLWQIFVRINKKLINVDDFVREHDKAIDIFISKLIEKASSLKQQFKILVNEKYKFCLLGPLEKVFIQKLREKEFQNLTGKYFNQLFQQVLIVKKYQNKKNQIISQMSQNIKKILQRWKKLETQCNIQLKTIQNFIKQRQNNFNTLNFNDNFLKESSIVKTSEQKEIISDLFKKQIKKIELLDKASQNQSKKLDSLLQKYANIQNIQNKLILIQTRFGNKLGEFTSLLQKKSQNSSKAKIVSDQDQQCSSFIFSIPNYEKFMSKQKVKESLDQNKNKIGSCFYKENVNADISIHHQEKLNFKFKFNNFEKGQEQYQKKVKVKGISQQKSQNHGLHSSNIYVQQKVTKLELWKIVFHEEEE